MSNVISCISCGKTVSKSAYECPHCKIEDFQGVTCKCCGRRLARQSSCLLGSSGFHFHRECLTALFAKDSMSDPQVRCIDCNAPLNLGPWTPFRLECPCEHCGCREPIPRSKSADKRCCFCSLPIYSFQELCASYDSNHLTYNHYHLPCYNMESEDKKHSFPLFGSLFTLLIAIFVVIVAVAIGFSVLGGVIRALWRILIYITFNI